MHAPVTLIHAERLKFEVPNSKWSEQVAADTVENTETLGEKEYLKKKWSIGATRSLYFSCTPIRDSALKIMLCH